MGVKIEIENLVLIGSKGQNINQKLQQKTFYPKNPNLNYWKNRDYKNFRISEWFINFSIKISEKKKKIIWQFCFESGSIFSNGIQNPNPFFPVRSRIRIHFFQWDPESGSIFSQWDPESGSIFSSGIQNPDPFFPSGIQNPDPFFPVGSRIQIPFSQWNPESRSMFFQWDPESGSTSKLNRS